MLAEGKERKPTKYKDVKFNNPKKHSLANFKNPIWGKSMIFQLSCHLLWCSLRRINGMSCCWRRPCSGVAVYLS